MTEWITLVDGRKDSPETLEKFLYAGVLADGPAGRLQSRNFVHLNGKEVCVGTEEAWTGKRGRQLEERSFAEGASPPGRALPGELDAVAGRCSRGDSVGSIGGGGRRLGEPGLMVDYDGSSRGCAGHRIGGSSGNALKTEVSEAPALGSVEGGRIGAADGGPYF